MIAALVALLYALPEILRFISRLDGPRDAATVMAKINEVMDGLEKAKTPEDHAAAAMGLAHFWASRG